MKRYLISIFSIVMFAFLSCDKMSVSNKLAEIDSLIVANQYAEAYDRVNELNEGKIDNEEDLVHYLLLKYQTCCLTMDTAPDSLLKCATEYYEKSDNAEKLAECYYYEGYTLARKRDYNNSILLLKAAETQAQRSKKIYQQFKIAEILARINNSRGNYDMELDYGRKALTYALQADRKDWIAYAYNQLGLALAGLDKTDSAMYYFEKTEPYIKYIREEDQPYFLSNLSLVYLDQKPEISKQLLQESLTYKELIGALEQLALIYYEEGNQEEAYRLLTRALTLDGLTPKDNIIHNLLEYDIEHGRTDKVCDRVNEIIAIKDSIINTLKNDTLKDLQTRFDHEVTMNAANERLFQWQRGLGIVLFLLMLFVGYAKYRKDRLKGKLMIWQTKIQHLIEQIDQKGKEAERTSSLIDALQSETKLKDDTIQKLNRQREEVEKEVQKLSAQLENWAGAEAAKVRLGALLMKEVEQNKPIRHWTDDKQEALIVFYCALHPDINEEIRGKRKSLSAKEKLYLILCDMKKSSQEMSEILGIDIKTLRTYKFRVKKKNQTEEAPIP